MPDRRLGRPLVGFTLVLALALGGCRATGRTANAYFDWGGRTFTTNPVSLLPYGLGFGVFFLAGLPLDLFSWIVTEIGWPDGRGEDYQGSALAPSIFLGTTGGVLLGAPFFPLGLPWWDPDGEDTEAPAAAPPAKQAPPPKEAPPESSTPAPPERADPGDVPAGAPRR